MKKCKHKWHLHKITEVNLILLMQLTKWGYVPAGTYKIGDFMAVFVCEKCGQIKRIKTKESKEIE